LRILSHQMHRHTNQGLPARTENLTRYKPYSGKWRFMKQAGEIQNRVTFELKEQVSNEATNPGKYSPLEF
jgi:hypothetical protein